MPAKYQNESEKLFETNSSNSDSQQEQKSSQQYQNKYVFFIILFFFFFFVLVIGIVMINTTKDTSQKVQAPQKSTKMKQNQILDKKGTLENTMKQQKTIKRFSNNVPQLKMQLKLPTIISQQPSSIPLALSFSQLFLHQEQNQKKNVQQANYLYKSLLEGGQQDKNRALQMQYQKLNSKYNLDEEFEEKPFCILSPFFNFKSKPKHLHYFEALNAQNYSSFKVIMIDDSSDDGSFDYIIDTIKQYPKVNNRLFLLQNSEHVGALGNKDYAIRHYCESQSIIIELDFDDWLIGTQVLNVYNRVYQRQPWIWFLYSNYIWNTPDDKKELRIGKCRRIEDKIFEQNIYRTIEKYWVTIHLRSYRRALYMKIPTQYFLDTDGTYYLWAADRFTMFALVELAGKDHTNFLNQLFYFYNQPNDGLRAKTGCTLANIHVYDSIARKQTPLLNIKWLDMGIEAEQTSNYVIPEHTIKKYEQRKAIYNSCILKQR